MRGWIADTRQSGWLGGGGWERLAWWTQLV